MKYLLIVFMFTLSINAQKNYFNEEGKLTSEYNRDLILAAFKDYNLGGNQYEIENKFLVIISKSECDNSIAYGETQKRTLSACVSQLLTQIHLLQRFGFKDFENAEFEGIVFKTNYICSHETRRYYFKFTLNELKKFQEYIDIDELFEYILVKNNNSNIIYIKNQK